MLRRYFPEHEVDVIPHGSRLRAWLDADATPSARRLADAGRRSAGGRGPRRHRSRQGRATSRAPGRTDARAGPAAALGADRLPRSRPGAVAIATTACSPCTAPTIRARLPELLEHYRVRLVAYPSAGPETFSFTLSEAWAAGRPAIVPPIGALADRVAGTGAGWVLSDDEWRSEALMLERIASLLDPAHGAAFAAAEARARTAPQPAAQNMVDATLAVYRETCPRGAPRQTFAPIAVERCLAALDYSPWKASPPPVPETPAAETPVAAAPASPVPGDARPICARSFVRAPHSAHAAGARAVPSCAQVIGRCAQESPLMQDVDDGEWLPAAGCVSNAGA